MNNNKEELKKLPDKWFIFAKTKDKARFLFPHFNRLQGLSIGWEVDNLYHIEDYCLIFNGKIYDSRFKNNKLLEEFTEISFEDFKRLVLKEETMENKTQAIKIPEDLLFTYYKASQPHQKEYLNKHFQLDGSTTVEAIKGLYDIACNEWKPKIKSNHPDCFKEDKVWKRESNNTESTKFHYLERCSNNGFKVSNGNSRYSNINTTFKTLEEADNNALLYNTMMLMRSWAKFYNEVDGFKVDWTDHNQSKYGINPDKHKLTVDYRTTINTYIFLVSVKTKERAEEMLAEFKDDLEKLIQLGMFN